jgi:hypothetical protein
MVFACSGINMAMAELEAGHVRPWAEYLQLMHSRDNAKQGTRGAAAGNNAVKHMLVGQCGYSFLNDVAFGHCHPSLHIVRFLIFLLLSLFKVKYGWNIIYMAVVAATDVKRKKDR